MQGIRQGIWLLGFAALAVAVSFRADAQQVAVPVGALPRGPVESVKAADVVNLGGLVSIPLGQQLGAVYTVPFGKRLIVTCYSVDQTHFGIIDLVENAAGTITDKYRHEFLGSYIGVGASALLQNNTVGQFAFPCGLRFEPGTVVALRRPASQVSEAWEVPVLLVGALVDA